MEMNKSSKSASMENRYPYVHSRETKKNKVIWTPDLHKKFLEAVEEIGVDEAVPKKILELMEVEGLTRDHVASHLQKYRIFLKKIADANKQVQIASEPSLLESSMIKGDGDPWKKNSSLMLNQPTPQQKNFPSYSRMHEMMNPSVLDTSSFSFPVLEASTFNTGTSSEPIHSCSLPNQGYSMQPSTILAQTIPNGLDRERELIADDPDLGVMNSVCVNSSNSSNSSFEHNLDSLMYDYCDSTTDVYPYMSIEMGSSCGLYSMSHGELVEMDLYGCNSNEVSTYSRNKMEMGIDPSNLQNVIEEDDLLLDAAYIASLWETFFPEEQYVDYESTSNNTPVTYEPPYKDMNSQILPNMVSFDSIHNGDNVNKEQHSNEQQIESVEDDVTLQTLILNSYVQD